MMSQKKSTAAGEKTSPTGASQQQKKPPGQAQAAASALPPPPADTPLLNLLNPKNESFFPDRLKKKLGCGPRKAIQWLTTVHPSIGCRPLNHACRSNLSKSTILSILDQSCKLGIIDRVLGIIVPSPPNDGEDDDTEQHQNVYEESHASALMVAVQNQLNPEALKTLLLYYEKRCSHNTLKIVLEARDNNGMNCIFRALAHPDDMDWSAFQTLWKLSLRTGDVKSMITPDIFRWTWIHYAAQHPRISPRLFAVICRLYFEHAPDLFFVRGVSRLRTCLHCATSKNLNPECFEILLQHCKAACNDNEEVLKSFLKAQDNKKRTCVSEALSNNLNVHSLHMLFQLCYDHTTLADLLTTRDHDGMTCFTLACRNNLNFDSFHCLLKFCANKVLNLGTVLSVQEMNVFERMLDVAHSSRNFDFILLTIAFFPTKELFNAVISAKNVAGEPVIDLERITDAKVKKQLKDPDCWEKCKTWYQTKFGTEVPVNADDHPPSLSSAEDAEYSMRRNSTGDTSMPSTNVFVPADTGDGADGVAFCQKVLPQLARKHGIDMKITDKITKALEENDINDVGTFLRLSYHQLKNDLKMSVGVSVNLFAIIKAEKAARRMKREKQYQVRVNDDDEDDESAEAPPKSQQRSQKGIQNTHVRIVSFLNDKNEIDSALNPIRSPNSKYDGDDDEWEFGSIYEDASDFNLRHENRSHQRQQSNGSVETQLTHVARNQQHEEHRDGGDRSSSQEVNPNPPGGNERSNQRLSQQHTSHANSGVAVEETPRDNHEDDNTAGDNNNNEDGEDDTKTTTGVPDGANPRSFEVSHASGLDNLDGDSRIEDY